jgi:hypothetical protein
VDVKLEVRFEGTAPGLPEHRLSLGAFGKALDQLLATYRRIASGMITNALDEPGYGMSGGKYAKEAERLDLELEAIRVDRPRHHVHVARRRRRQPQPVRRAGARRESADARLH